MTRIVFMGTPDFSVAVLERIISDGYDVVAVVTQPDRPVGRKRILTPPPVKVAAEKYGIPVLQPEKIRNPEELEKVFAYKPDLLVTAAFGQILPKELLDFPSYGCINVHASLLPELRGGAPIHYALMQGKAKTGVTIMYMAERLDAGDMISKVDIEIEELDHTGSLHEKLSVAGSQLLSETLPKLLAGEIKAVPQDDSLATFARNIKREEELIDWTKSGRAVYNHIRGLHPWPVAYTTLDGATVKIWWGTPHENAEITGVAGEIVKIEKDGFVVKTGDSISIKITDLQLSGKTRIKAEELLRSTHPFQVGTILGNT
ncbi:MAG: methionyl-tRNA formyltransferase [Bacillales bacterium]|jgi:methionyl-tRNA formyltransferase|nr:methionyl-tRNA formyltransferase [Bacillales bacterium]